MDLQRENTELVSSVSRLEAGRRESVSSGEGEFSHAKEASVLSDSSFEAATTKTTGSSSGVSSDLSDSDNDVSSDQSDPGTQSPSQVRRYFYLLSLCNVCGCNVHLRHILFGPRQFQCQSGTIRSCSLALVKHNPFHFIFTLHQKRPSIILIGMWSVISND